ncbi:MAG: di-trans,poly-cis-decaprenylcistransferase [Spirochaetia bacterium]|jgi:undecaprenyl diphosphate synthase|nr:di-trans,poly-cis-decaprenylcistransferase [Spirochaetia bacterium]
MKDYKKELDASRIPGHIGIIMDGNGRWAETRSKSRGDGHKHGSEIIEPVMDACIELGVKAVSLYAFSMENWSRPKAEISGLWNLFEYFFNTKLDILVGKGIRVVHSGSLKRLPPKIKRLLADVVKKTAGNKKIFLNLCINYGGRQEIVDGVNNWLERRKDGEMFTMKKMEKHLYTAGLPETDLIIRTSGEYRISNFMLWQLAYAELVFTDILWPDFAARDLYKAIYDYQQRERRFGNI